MFSKLVFLGAPENSLGEKASEAFADTQQGKNNISQVFSFSASQPSGKRSGKLRDPPVTIPC